MSTLKTKISTATTADIPAIQAIAHEVWPVAYANIISTEQIAYMLQMMYSTTSLKQQIGEQQHEFLLLKHEDTVAGFAGFSDEGGHRFKLHKLYVLSSLHGTGLGKMLLDEVCSRATLRNGLSLELQVNKNNPAKLFYERQGFVVDRELVVDIGGGFVMDDFVMKKGLA